MENKAMQVVSGVKPNMVNWIGAMIGAALAWWTGLPPLAQALLIVQGADILTGLLCAVTGKSRKTESGALDSKAGYIGLLKKGMILLVVWLGVLLDNALGETYIRMAVVLFFVGNEGLSLLENLGLMGVPFPTFLERALEALREQGDNGKGGSNANP